MPWVVNLWFQLPRAGRFLLLNGCLVRNISYCIASRNSGLQPPGNVTRMAARSQHDTGLKQMAIEHAL